MRNLLLGLVVAFVVFMPFYGFADDGLNTSKAGFALQQEYLDLYNQHDSELKAMRQEFEEIRFQWAQDRVISWEEMNEFNFFLQGVKDLRVGYDKEINFYNKRLSFYNLSIPESIPDYFEKENEIVNSYFGGPNKDKKDGELIRTYFVELTGQDVSVETGVFSVEIIIFVALTLFFVSFLVFVLTGKIFWGLSMVITLIVLFISAGFFSGQPSL